MGLENETAVINFNLGQKTNYDLNKELIAFVSLNIWFLRKAKTHAGF